MRDAATTALPAHSLRDLSIRAAIWAAAMLVAGAFVWLLADLLWHGAGRVDWSFLTTAPKNAGRGGGIAPILVSTGLILAVAIVLAAPLGLATAVFLAEFTRATSASISLASLIERRVCLGSAL